MYIAICQYLNFEMCIFPLTEYANPFQIKELPIPIDLLLGIWLVNTLRVRQ